MSNAAMQIKSMNEDSKQSDELSSGGRLATSDGRELPLRHSDLDVTAVGGVARAILTQRFENPYDEPLSVHYLLPMPADGAVSGFSFVIGERRIEGEVDRKARARERFEEAIVSGHTAALVEQQRSSLFTQELGNIPPRTEVIAEISVDQKLRWHDDGWQWRFPTVVGSRYMGAAGRVKDAAAQIVDVAEKGIGARVSLTLKIADRLAEMDSPVRSPSHPLDVDQRRGAVEVALRNDTGVRLDRDLVVCWSVKQPKVGVSLAVARPSSAAHNGRSFGLITVVPPASKMKAVARDLIFLVDTSGSMGGRPLKQAARIAAAMIDTLGKDDRIELIEFGSRPVRWKREPTLATRDGKKEAIKWLRNLRASGATEMRDGVIEALSPLRADSQRQVVLITDGYIGFEAEIIETILERLPNNARLHTVGVGSAINRSLTGPAARAGHGVELVVGLEEDAEKVADKLVARTAAPLVTELSIEGDCVHAIAPAQMPDLFSGSPALISLELDPKGGEIEVKGRCQSGDFLHRVDVPATTLGEGEQGLTALFGRERVEDLETLCAARGDVQEIDLEIERIGLDFQIATRLTSWIAVSEEQMVDPKDPGRKVRMPHELPYGTSIEGFGLRGGPDLSLSMTQTGVLGRRSLSSMPMQAPSGMMFEDHDEFTGQMPSAERKRLSRRSPLRFWLWLLIIAALIAALVYAFVGCAPSPSTPSPECAAPCTESVPSQTPPKAKPSVPRGMRV